MRGFFTALGFLTILPAPKSEDFGKSVAWFPVIGLLLGGILYFAATGFDLIFSPVMSAIFIVALHALLTGALHLDGWSDVFDGFGGGRGNRDRVLEIMRDSRIGAFGATALLFLVLIKIATVLEADKSALLIFPIVGRAAAALAIVGFPYARPDGLGKAFRSDRLQAFAATCFSLIVLAWAGYIVLGLTVLALAILGAIMISRKLGGLTGDVYGGIIEGAETLFLLLSIVQGGGR